jgi:hypothetical protein
MGAVVSVTPRPPFTPGRKDPQMGGWVGLTADVDTETRGKIIFLFRGSKPCRLVCSQALYWVYGQTLYWLSYGEENSIKHHYCELGLRLCSVFLHLKVCNISSSSFPVPVCAITASGVPGGTLVSMNRFSTLRGRLAQRQGWRVKGWIWPSEQVRSAKANSWLDYQMGDRKW